MVLDERRDYKDWERKNSSGWSKLSKQIKPIHVVLLPLLILAANFAYSSGKISKTMAIVIVIPFIVLIMFLIYRESSTPKLIPEHIIKQIAQDALERKRIRGIEIPFDSRVRVTLVGEGVYETDMYTGTSGIIRRDVGFEVIKKGLRKTGVIGVHPYNGTILGIRWERMGYTGKESKDRILLPVGFIERKIPHSET